MMACPLRTSGGVLLQVLPLGKVHLMAWGRTFSAVALLQRKFIWGTTNCFSQKDRGAAPHLQSELQLGCQNTQTSADNES